MKIIVTGGSGFLGKHLCRSLVKSGHQVKNIDLLENKEIETVIADVRDRQLMDNEITNADAVFHLASLIQAGESVKKPQKYIDFNINGTLSVLDAMRNNGIKTFIFSSSAAIYGEPIQVPIMEDDRYLPINPYGMTKLAMEALLSSYVKAFSMTGVALRYFNLYGPEEHHQPETHAIPRFIHQISKDQPVTVWGDGHHQRDYIYISDIVDAHLKALSFGMDNTQEYHYFNLSTQKPISVIDLIAKIEKILGKSAKIEFGDPRLGDPDVLTANAEKAKKQLGWQSVTDLEYGLKQTISYFQKHEQENK